MRVQQTRRVTIESLEERQLFAAYTIASIGTLSGYSDFTALGMNNSGHIAGYAGTTTTRAIVSKAGVITAVAGTGSKANDINDLGNVVYDLNGSSYIKKGTTTTKLNAFTDNPTSASDLNNQNALVLCSFDTSGFYSHTTYRISSTGARTMVGGTYTGVLNDAGVVAADFSSPGDYGFQITKGTSETTVLNLSVGGINNLNMVVGYSPNDNRAFLYELGGSVKKFGATGVAPKAINDQGIIVGHTGEQTSSTTDDKAFVIRNGVVTNLNTLVTLPSGVTLTDAVAINNKGQIAVNGLKSGKRVAFLLTPTDTASISGRVFNDANKNGVKNTGEVGLSGWRVYVDSNKSGVWDIGEQIAQTNSTGDYKLSNLSAGIRRIYEVRQTGWTRSLPSGVYPLGYYDVTLTSTATILNKDFGNWK